MRSIISLAIWSVHFDQASTTLLYFSSWVMRPSLYCCSYSRTRSLVCSTNLGLGLGDHHVVLAERDAGLEGVVEAEPHDAVAEDHRLLLPAVAVDGVDQAGDGLLGQQLVDERELARPASCGSSSPSSSRPGVVSCTSIDLVALVIDGRDSGPSPWHAA